MAEPLDVQQKLDDWLAEHPDVQKYVSKLWYIPEGSEAPPECTHKLRLSSLLSPERALTVGIVVVGEFAVFVDAILAMIATQPPQP